MATLDLLLLLLLLPSLKLRSSALRLASVPALWVALLVSRSLLPLSLPLSWLLAVGWPRDRSPPVVFGRRSWMLLRALLAAFRTVLVPEMLAFLLEHRLLVLLLSLCLCIGYSADPGSSPDWRTPEFGCSSLTLLFAPPRRLGAGG